MAVSETSRSRRFEARRPAVLWLCPGLRAVASVLASAERGAGDTSTPRQALLSSLAAGSTAGNPASSLELCLWRLVGGSAGEGLPAEGPDVHRVGDVAQVPGARCRLAGQTERSAWRSVETVDGPLVCADPVHFRPDRDQARVLPGAALALQPEEADGLLESLNALVSEDGLTFFRTSLTDWYLQGLPGEALNCLPSTQIAHRTIDQYPPPLTNGSAWRRLMSEVQMLMHAHPINAERAARGVAAVNGLWFWGGGNLAPGIKGRSGVVLYADDDFARGLGGFAGWPVHEPASAMPADGFLPATGASAEASTVVFVDTNVRDALILVDPDAMEQALDDLATHRLAPLQAWLDTGRVSSVTLDTCDTLTVALRRQRRSVWSRLFASRRFTA